MPPRPSLASQRDDLPTWDVTGRRPRLVSPSSAILEAQPSPLLEAIRAYLERAR